MNMTSIQTLPQTRRGFLASGAALALAAAPLGLPFGAPGAALAQGRPGFFAARDIAEAAYVYGLPLVMNYGVMYEYIVDKTSGQWKAPFNQIYNDAQVFTWKDTAVVTPNSDTPYSLVWLDLRAEPVVISVPAVDPKRYYAAQMIDANTYIYGYVGSRTTGSEAGSYMIVGPHWTGARPEGVKGVFQSGTDFSLVIFRTQLFAPDDIDNVKAVQAGYQVRPLSAFVGDAAPADLPDPGFPAFTKDLAKEDFFEFLDFALTHAPEQPNEAWIREQLARIGVGPRKNFSFRDLSLEDKAETLLGLAEGKKKVDAYLKTAGVRVNGWSLSSMFGDAAFFHGDWLLRAAGAQGGIFGNYVDEAAYPVTRVDADGAELDGSKASYTITFAKDALPPVNAFWSITMYDGKTQLLIENPIDRYLINSPMLPELKRDADGSLTLLIQHADPGADRRANWLPAPNGPIYLVMRLYWPRTEAPSLLPIGRGTWSPPGVIRAS